MGEDKNEEANVSQENSVAIPVLGQKTKQMAQSECIANRLEKNDKSEPEEYSKMIIVVEPNMRGEEIYESIPRHSN